MNRRSMLKEKIVLLLLLLSRRLTEVRYQEHKESKQSVNHSGGTFVVVVVVVVVVVAVDAVCCCCCYLLLLLLFVFVVEFRRKSHQCRKFALRQRTPSGWVRIELLRQFVDTKKCAKTRANELPSDVVTKDVFPGAIEAYNDTEGTNSAALASTWRLVSLFHGTERWLDGLIIEPSPMHLYTLPIPMGSGKTPWKSTSSSSFTAALICSAEISPILQPGTHQIKRVYMEKQPGNQHQPQISSQHPVFDLRFHWSNNQQPGTPQIQQVFGAMNPLLAYTLALMHLPAFHIPRGSQKTTLKPTSTQLPSQHP
ncbi:hypothetical protein THAOC_08563, partial [Thalassiosira oceanica]